LNAGILALQILSLTAGIRLTASDNSCERLAANAANSSFDEPWKARVFSKLLARGTTLAADGCGIAASRCRSQAIHRTSDAKPAAIEHVNVDHRGAGIGVS